jgi:hypothetical protein
MSQRVLVLDKFTELGEESYRVQAGEVLAVAYDWASGTRGYERTATHVRFYTPLPPRTGYRVALRYTVTRQLSDEPGDVEEVELPPVLSEVVEAKVDLDYSAKRPEASAQWVGFWLLGPDGARLGLEHAYWPEPPRFATGYWRSKPFKLSDFLLELSDVRLELNDGSAASWKAGQLAAKGWSLELGLQAGETAEPVWYTAPPARADIARAGYTHARLKLSYTTPTALSVEAVRLDLVEEYAPGKPATEVRLGKSNLYVPKLRVSVGGVDLTEYVSAFTRKSLTLAVPDDRYHGLFALGAAVQVELDNADVLRARVSGLEIEPYANGDVVELELEAPVDTLNRSEDVEVVVTPDGASKQLPFADDLGYIAYVLSFLTPGVRPFVEDKQAVWRPMTVWKQNPDTAAGEVKLVALDTDYDWLQLYALRNQSARSKLDQVAQANGFTLKSYAGMPYLVRLAPHPIAPDLTQLPALRLHVDAAGNFLPDVRFGVPNLRVNGVPVRELRLVGLAGAQTAPAQPVSVWFLDAQGNPTREARASSTFARVEVPLVDSQGNAAVYKNLEVRFVEARNIDLNPFANPSTRYELVYGTVNGYYGVTKLVLRVDSPPMVYYEAAVTARGLLVYSASGGRADEPQWASAGKHVPGWARYGGSNLVGEMLARGTSMSGNKESVQNDFVPKYVLPEGQESFTVAGYTVYSDHAERLVDALALRQALEWVTAEMSVVGFSGLAANQVLAVPRLPPGGVGASVTTWDYYLVLEEPELYFQAGGQIRTSVKLGYMGTVQNGVTVYAPFGRTWRGGRGQDEWLWN